MIDRNKTIARFLRDHHCEASVDWLPADASMRRYGRVSRAGQSLVLMDAPPEAPSNTSAFVTWAELLQDIEITAPRIFAQDFTQGLLLISDLGSVTMTQRLGEHPDQTEALYDMMFTTINQLQQRVSVSPPTIVAYDSHALHAEISLFPEWYCAAAGIRIDTQGWVVFAQLTQKYLRTMHRHPPAMVLRDCHPDNFMYVSEPSIKPRCGVLDFQDGGWGSALYDVTSLLFDVRRDVPTSIQQDIMHRHAAILDIRDDCYQAMAAWLILQRSLKILGIFVRLNARDGKARYLKWLPRCWQFVDYALDFLPDWQAWFDQHMPKRPAGLAILAADNLDTAMFLAAGKGTRMGTLGKTTPKPMLAVAGKAIIDHSRDVLKQAGVGRHIVNTHHLADQVRQHFQHEPDVQVITEDTLLETGGGVVNALPLIARDCFWMVNGDALVQVSPETLSAIQSVFRILQSALSPRKYYDDLAMALLCVMPLEQWQGSDARADFYFAEETTIKKITEKPCGRLVRASCANAQQQQGLGYCGMLVLHRAAMVGYRPGKFSMNRVFDDLLARKRLWGVVLDGTYYHVGTPQALAEANVALQG